MGQGLQISDSILCFRTILTRTLIVLTDFNLSNKPILITRSRRTLRADSRDRFFLGPQGQCGLGNQPMHRNVLRYTGGKHYTLDINQFNSQCEVHVHTTRALCMYTGDASL